MSERLDPDGTPVLRALPDLGYGAANLGNLYRELTDDEARGVLEAAWDAGIRYYDTAPHYGLGLSERRLGAFLQTKPRDEYIVSTKVGHLLRPNPDPDPGLDLRHEFHVPATLYRHWDFSGDGIRTGLAESLERLGLDRVDILYLHDPEKHDLDAAVAEALPAMAELRDEGVLGAVGVGSMVNASLTAAVTGPAKVDLIMIAGRYTLLEPSAADEVLPACHERGTSAVAASVFNSGLLANARPSREGRYQYGALPEELWDRLQELVRVCDAHGVPLPAAAVQFPMREQAIVSVVVGGSRGDQVRQSAEWMRAPIPEGFWNDLRARGLVPA